MTLLKKEKWLGSGCVGLGLRCTEEEEELPQSSGVSMGAAGGQAPPTPRMLPWRSRGSQFGEIQRILRDPPGDPRLPLWTPLGDPRLPLRTLSEDVRPGEREARVFLFFSFFFF